MKIAVCIKQVPDTTEGVKYNPDGTINRAALASVINPADKAAIEAALQIKEACGAQVVLLTMGLMQAEDILRYGLALGADEAVLLTDRRLAGADTLATSYSLAGAIRILSPDIVITGSCSSDGETSHVPAQLSDILNIPVISDAWEIEAAQEQVQAKRKTSAGYQLVSAKLPCLISVGCEAYKARYMTPAGIFDAADAPITVLGRDDLSTVSDDQIGFAGSYTKTETEYVEQKKTACRMIEAESPDEATQRITEILS